MSIYTWAIKHGVSHAALQELLAEFGAVDNGVPDALEMIDTEAAVQNQERLEFSRQGGRAWRNNVGALKDEKGRMVRYGLANDSKKLNGLLKSSDLIGIRPVRITVGMVGRTIGQFWSRECKTAGWYYTATEREVAQLNWINLINSLGGDAAFTNGSR